MKLKDYIKAKLKSAKKNEMNFNIGIDTNMEVNNKSCNRVKFTAIKGGHKMAKKTIKKAEPRLLGLYQVAKPKSIEIKLDPVEVYQLKRALDIATAGACPGDIKSAVNNILAKLN